MGTNHDPFFQNVVLLFDMPILYLFALKIKRYTPSQGKWSMFYIPPYQKEVPHFGKMDHVTQEL
jgi:hypothetical protein